MSGGASSGGSASFSSGGGGSMQGDYMSGGAAGGAAGWGGGNDILPFMVADNLWDITGKKRRRRSVGSIRNKRQAMNGGRRPANRDAYQALVTNCGGEKGRPSIMIVGNQHHVKVALKTYNNEPAVIEVPTVRAVEFCVYLYLFIYRWFISFNHYN